MKTRHFLLGAIVATTLPTTLAENITWDITPGTVGPGDSAITGGTGIWNTTNGNWTIDGGANNFAWDNAANAPDTAVFQGTGGTVTLNNGGAAINAGGISILSNGYTLAGETASDVLHFGGQGSISTSTLGSTGSNVATISANLTGSSGLTIASHGNLSNNGGSSSARLDITGNNSGLTGGIAITSGLVRFDSANSAGSNTLTLSNGGGLVVSSGDLTLGNNISVGTGGGTLRAWGSRTLTLNGEISGTGGLTKTDGGTLVVSGNNTYSGGTNIGGGTIRLANTGSSNALGSGTITFAANSTLANGTSAGATAKTLSNNIVINSGVTASVDGGWADLTLSGNISGAGALTKHSTGNVTLSGTNTYDGNTLINAGTLIVSGGSLSSIGQIKVGNAASSTAGFNQTSGAITLSSTMWVADAATTTTAVVNFSGGTYSNSANLLIATRGIGTVNVSGTADVSVNTINFGHGSVSTGATSGTLNLDGGTLTTHKILKGTAGTSSIGTSVFNFNGGNLKAGASDIAFFTGIQRANVRNAGAKIDTNGFDITIGQALEHSNIDGDNAIDGGLTKTGAGTLTLSGNSTYTGATAVSAGTLLVTGSLGNTAVSVANGAILGGGGTIGGSLDFASGAMFFFNEGGAALTVNGTSVTFGNFSIADLFGLDSSTENGIYTIIDGSATIDWTNVANVGAANAYDLGDGKSAYFQAGSLQVVVIPEPATALLGGLGLLAMLRRRRD